MKANLVITPLLVMLLLAAPGCGSEASGEVVSNPDNPNSITVDNFVMSWNITEGNLSVTMSAPTTGWVSVGFEPSSAMKDADIIIGYVTEQGPFIRDDWGDGFISHRADVDLGGSDDVSIISGSEQNGTTEISFSIPLNSGDSYDKVLHTGETFKVIMAFGPDDADDFMGYHVWAETIELEL